MLLGIMAFGAFFDNFLAVIKLLAFPFYAVYETGNRIVNKVVGAFDNEDEVEEF